MAVDPSDPKWNVLSLSGPLTLYESSETRETLAAALADGKDLRVDLEMTGPWDLAGLQLLVSAVATARKAELELRLENVPRVCREIAVRSGLADWLAEVAGAAVA